MGNSIRQVPLALKVWCRLRRAKKALARLKLELEEARDDLASSEQYHKEEIESLKAKHEKALLTERFKNEILHTEWANRFLQLQKLGVLGINSSLVEERVDSVLQPTPTAQALTDAQEEELEFRKNKFFEDGLRAGKSPSEISQRWRELESDIISDVRLAII